MVISGRTVMHFSEQSRLLGNGVNDGAPLKVFLGEMVMLQSETGIYGKILQIWEMMA